MEGRVYLIGCGVSERHLTVEAVKAIRESDVVLYDRLIDKKILEKVRGRKIYVGKTPKESSKQEWINSLLYKYPRNGKVVARLKGGDAFFFSRGFEEYDYLRKKGVDVKVIPGISAFQALSEYGIPLTCRGKSSSVSFITGSKASDSIKYTGLDADTLVFYMPVGNLKKIVAQVRKHKKNPYCLLIENAGKPDYRIISGGIDEIMELAEEAEVKPPALFVVTSHRRQLYAKKVLTFRQKSREKETIKKLKGYQVVNYPLYTVKYREIGKVKAKVYAFTSPNAVESVFSQHKPSGKFVAIGDKTREALEKYDVKARIPRIQSSTGLMKFLSRYNKKEVIVFCSPRTRVKGYKRIYAYDISYKKQAPGLRKLINESEALLITSSEILNTLCDLASVKSLNAKTIVVIGGKTAVSAKKQGLHVDFMLEKPLIEEVAKLR